MAKSAVLLAVLSLSCAARTRSLRPPELLFCAPGPEMPPEAVKRDLSGVVMVHFAIDAEGRVGEVESIGPVPEPMFLRPVESFLQSCRYRPARDVDGQPWPLYLTEVYSFRQPRRPVPAAPEPSPREEHHADASVSAPGTLRSRPADLQPRAVGRGGGGIRGLPGRPRGGREAAQHAADGSLQARAHLAPDLPLRAGAHARWNARAGEDDSAVHLQSALRLRERSRAP